jgi:hypothetical protein
METILETSAPAPVSNRQITFPHLFVQVTDEETGEVYSEPRIAYVEGQPLSYRFDGKTGRFNRNGKDELGKEFAFQPIGWRQFTGNLFDRKDNTRWVEFYFLDENDCASTILFNNSSELNFTKALKDLVYSRRKLEEMRVTVTTEKLAYDVTLPDGQPQKGVYYAAVFTFTEGDKDARSLGRDVCRAYPVYSELTARATKTNGFVSAGYAGGLFAPAPETPALLPESASGPEPAHPQSPEPMALVDVIN